MLSVPIKAGDEEIGKLKFDKVKEPEYLTRYHLIPQYRSIKHDDKLAFELTHFILEVEDSHRPQKKAAESK